jgi:uncharacterized protein YpmB
MMSNTKEERKVIYTLLFCLIIMTAAYFFGKELGRYGKNMNQANTRLENVSNLNNTY